MEGITIFLAIINIIILAKLWGTCNVINSIGDVIIFERKSLKAKFIAEIEKLHEEYKNDPEMFRSIANSIAEQYEDKQKIRALDFKEMLKNFTW